MYKILTLGGRDQTCQIDRIERGFKELGHFLCNINENVDFIYCNDANYYNEALEIKRIKNNCKLILNVLDIPPHLLDSKKYDVSRYPFVDYPYNKAFDILNLQNKLLLADIVTCICDDVKLQLKQWCNIDATTIYNPIKPVSFLSLSENNKIKNKRGIKYKYLYVGRANDPNKRFYIVHSLMRFLNEPSDLLAVLGSENPGWGDYYNVVSDEILNLFYNSVDYFLFPSAFKSIGLPALESVVTRTIPIVCNDDPVTKEFWLDIGVDSHYTKIVSCIQNSEWNKKAKNFVIKNSDIYKEKFSGKSIAQNIINVYESIRANK